ncbi:hypothetical protein ACFL6G_10290, partial [candidate division KSB1 bacterium]
ELYFEPYPPRLSYNSKDTIEWSCAEENAYFAVEIGADTPLTEERSWAYTGAQKPDSPVISMDVHDDAFTGHYKYTVALFKMDTNGNVTFLTDDPEFIIKRD